MLAMLFGAHFLLYSTDAAADRRFFSETLGWPAVDAGEGWLIMVCPPTEMGVHPMMDEVLPAPDGLAPVQLYLMCDVISEEVATLRGKNVPVTDPEDMGFGLVSFVTLPSGARVGLYEPRHPLAATRQT
ncbi:MAG: hypothetical protein GEEBNDBF_00907 [bacterium]|nr:hypothetical protein [bacterium]